MNEQKGGNKKMSEHFNDVLEARKALRKAANEYRRLRILAFKAQAALTPADKAVQAAMDGFKNALRKHDLYVPSSVTSDQFLGWLDLET